MPIQYQQRRNVAAPGFLQTGAQDTIQAIAAGQAMRLKDEEEKRRKSLFQVAEQEARMKLEEAESQHARTMGFDRLHDDFITAVNAGDPDLQHQYLKQMRSIDPTKAREIGSFYTDNVKQMLGEAYPSIMGSIALPQSDMETKNMQMQRALDIIESYDDMHPAIDHIKGIMNATGEDRDKREMEAVAFLQQLGFGGGMGGEDQYKEREMRVKEAAIDLRRSEQEFRQDEAEWEKTRLTPSGEKILEKVDDRIFENEKTVGQYETLAQDFDRLSAEGVTGGKIGWAREKLKDWLGSQDEVSLLYRKFRGLRASGAVKNLPPGVASDKDIELALSGTPPEDAGPEYVASWLRGAAKMAKLDSLYHQARSNYLSENKTLANFSGWWKDNKAQIIADEFGMPLEEVMKQRPKAPKGMQETSRLNTMTTKEAATKTAEKIGAAVKEKTADIGQMSTEDLFKEFIK